MGGKKFYNGTFEQRTRRVFSVGEGLPSAEVLCAAFDSKETLFAGTPQGLYRLDGGKFVPAALKDCPVSMLFCDSAGNLWAAAGNRLFTITAKKASPAGEFDAAVTAMGEDAEGALYLLTETLLYKREPGRQAFHTVISVPGIGACLAVSADKKIFAGTRHSGLLGLIGKRPHWGELFKEFTGVLSNTVCSLSFDSAGYVWAGTDKGVCVYDGRGHWLSAKEVPALPKGRVNAMAFGADGARWFATDKGLTLLKDGVLKYYGFKRWVPSPKVHAVAVSPKGAVCAATAQGLSLIETRRMTLEDKARHYQETVEKHHVRKDGFVTVRFLDKPGDIESGDVEISDNDGTWTAMYMASQVYRYGATGEKDALENARRTLKALLKLTTVTGIEGFTARAVRYPGEIGFGDGDEEWHLDAAGECEWKGETSSDEMVGDFYGLSAYYDIAAGEAEKAVIADTIRKITDHILEHNFRLVDFDGLPTTWANWNPDDINLNDHWYAERGQNALEILSFLKTAFHMTGDKKYDEAYKKLISDHHYLMNTMHYKVEDYHSCHIDDELGMLVMTPLLKYEKDPVIRSYLMLGFTRHWQYERVERTPLWSVIYGSLTGRHCDIETAAESLELLPLDLIHWPTWNSHREDLEWITASEEFWMPPQLKEPLPHDEKPMGKYDSNPFEADNNIRVVKTEKDGVITEIVETVESGCSGERRVEDGTVFLHPYWMARYYGLLGD